MARAYFDDDETLVLSYADDGTARLWDAESGNAIGEPMRHSAAIEGAFFYDDESEVVTYADDGTIRFWDAETGEANEPLFRHRGAVFGVGRQ